MNDNFIRGIELMDRGMLREAEEFFLSWLTEHPNHAMGHNKLGLIYAKRNDHKKAKECFEKAIKYDPQLSHAWNNLGNIARKEGDLGQAREYYHKAIENEPNNPIPQRNLEKVEKQLRYSPSFAQLLRKIRQNK